MSSALQARYHRLVGRVSWLWLQVWLLTLLTVVQLVVFQVVVPPWQHFDEPAHFRYAWSLVNLVPAQQAAVFTPLDPVMVRETLGSMVENAFYRELTAPNYLRTHGLDTLGHSQSVEFRMYYDWVGWPLRIFRQADITTQLLAGRAVTSIFLLIVVWSSMGLMRSLTRSPAGGLLVLLAGLAVMSMGALVHLVTLPVEWDASFRRALPILEQGRYISPNDMDGARKILTAAALTYVAASLGGLLNIWRWIMLMRR